MKIDGRCSGVVYEADIDATKAIIRHCANRQQMFGTPYRIRRGERGEMARPVEAIGLTGFRKPPPFVRNKIKISPGSPILTPSLNATSNDGR